MRARTSSKFNVAAALGCLLSALSPAVQAACRPAAVPTLPRLPVPVQPRRQPLPRLPSAAQHDDQVVTVIGRQAFG